MRLAFSILIAAAISATGAEWTVNGRLILGLDSIPANRVSTLRQAITNQVDRADLLATSIETRLRTNSGVISAFVDLQFKTGSTYSNKVVTKWGALTNYNWPSGVTGFVSLHFCALDAANTNGYFPCDSTNAFYRRVNVP